MSDELTYEQECLIIEEDVITICKDCKTATRRLPPDSMDYCPMCEVVVEGNTEEISLADYDGEL